VYRVVSAAYDRCRRQVNVFLTPTWTSMLPLLHPLLKQEGNTCPCPCVLGLCLARFCLTFLVSYEVCGLGLGLYLGLDLGLGPGLSLGFVLVLVFGFWSWSWSFALARLVFCFYFWSSITFVNELYVLNFSLIWPST
jgi:hypothetical protein